MRPTRDIYLDLWVYWRRYVDKILFFPSGIPVRLSFTAFLLALAVVGLGTGFAAKRWGTATSFESTINATRSTQGLSAIWFDAARDLVWLERDKWKLTVRRLPADGTKELDETLDLDALTPSAPFYAFSANIPPGPLYSDSNPGSNLRQQRSQSGAIESQYTGQKSQAQRIPNTIPRTELPLALSVSPDASKVAWAWSGKLFIKNLSDKLKPVSQAYLRRGPAAAELAWVGNQLIGVQYGDGVLEVLNPAKTEKIASVNGEGPCRLQGSSRFLLYACLGSKSIAVFDAAETLHTSTSLYQVNTKFEFVAALSSTGIPVAATGDGTVLLASAQNRVMNQVLSAPGVVETLAFYDPRRIAVGGGFRGIYLLSPDAPPAMLLPDVTGTEILTVAAANLAFATTDHLQLVSLKENTVLSNRGKFILFSGILTFLALILAPAVRLQLEEFRIRYMEGPRRNESLPAPSEHAVVPKLPEPEPSKELVNACAAGECVAYVGAGLSAQAGYPLWSSLVGNLLEWAIDQNLIEPSLSQSLRAGVTQGFADSVADSIFFALRGKEKLLNDFMTAAFTRATPSLSAAHQHLSRIQFSAVLTTNFDDLLDRTFKDRHGRVYTYQDVEPLLGALTRREFFLLKLYGTPEKPETVLLAPAQFLQALANYSLLPQFMEGIFYSQTIFFVGASLEGIEAYLSAIKFRGNFKHQHFALVAVGGTAWQAKKDQLENRYKIKVIPYSPSPGFPEVPRFLAKLATAVDANRRPSRQTSRQPGRLKSITLENVGPFPELKVELTPQWNILLGDNGVGKSTILKAIAIAICGQDAAPYADRIISSSRDGRPAPDVATIALTTDQDRTYVTTIRRTDVGTQITCMPSRPLEVESWLALGFPPLRTVTWTRKRNLSPEGLERLTSGDLLSLIKGEPDPRLDNLKEWIVRLDYQIRKPNAPKRYQEQREELFRVINEITPGLKVEFKEVIERTFEVIVRTEDGEVPIEAVSQGTSSLLGWVGVLLQRLYDVYGPKEGAGEQSQLDPGPPIPPRERYALVLIDEIDAHMHPKWQQLIVNSLRKLFPNVQFVATTHSPLIVTGMNQNEVSVARRDPTEGRVIVTRAAFDMKGWHADQVLTGPLFDLTTTLDPELFDAMRRYSELAARDDLSELEKKELEEASLRINVRQLLPFEKDEARLAFEKIERLLDTEISAMAPEKRERILQAAKAAALERITKSRSLV